MPGIVNFGNAEKFGPIPAPRTGADGSFSIISRGIPADCADAAT